MPSITIEQALYSRPDRQAPTLRARSTGFTAEWLAEAQRLVTGFGDRRGGRLCPLAVFALPISKKHVAVVRVREETPTFPTGLRFHVIVVERKMYEARIRDPFMLAAKVEATWDATDTLPTLFLPEETFVPRTVDQVQGVLKRVKAAALKEGEDPESPDFERTVENSESPALLGGVQILVDGGKLAFERPEGDLRLVSGLWLLLPEATRSRLWPTSFAFSQELDFDVLIVPQLEETVLESYTTEEQAADYPQGAYEFALQQAAEGGDQRALDAVFTRRDGYQTIRLAIVILIVVSLAVLITRFVDIWPTPPRDSLPVQTQQIATEVGIIGVGDPWTAIGMWTHAKHLWPGQEKKRDGQ